MDEKVLSNKWLNKKGIITINIIFAILIIIADIIYISKVIPNKYIMKTITSALFVLCGGYNFLIVCLSNKDMRKKSAIMLIGLIFAFLGDVLLIEHFVIGAGLFAVGHIFFLVYFITLSKITLWDIVIAGVIFLSALLFILLYPNFNFNGMLPLVIVYALVISCMLGKAIGNYVLNKTNANLIMAVGAFLFFFSDLMLLFDVFSFVGRIFDILCLVTYYPAEFLLGITILLQAISARKNSSIAKKEEK